MLSKLLNYVVGFRSRSKKNMILAGLYYGFVICMGLSQKDLFALVVLLTLPLAVASIVDCIRFKSVKKIVPFVLCFVLYGVFPSGDIDVDNKSAQDLSKPNQIESIEIDSSDINFEKSGQAKIIKYTVNPGDADESAVVLVSDNPEVAEFRGNILTAVSEGETVIYAICETSGIKSEDVKVVVNTDDKSQSEESSNEEENDAVDREKADETESDISKEEKAEVSESNNVSGTADAESVPEPVANSETASGTEVVPKTSDDGVPANQATGEQSGVPVSENVEQDTSVSDNISSTVYIGKTGTKYHSQGCGTLKGGGIPISLDEALAQGRDACAKCGG